VFYAICGAEKSLVNRISFQWLPVLQLSWYLRYHINRTVIANIVLIHKEKNKHKSLINITSFYLINSYTYFLSLT